MAKTTTLVAVSSKQHYSESNLTANFNTLNNNFSNFLHMGGVTESGNTMLGNLDMGNLSVLNMATPSLASSAANKAYVDAQLADIALGTVSLTVELTNLESFGVNRGLVGGPSIYFVPDTDTGIYSPGEDQISLVVGGVSKLDITSAGIVSPAIVGGIFTGTFSGNHTKSGTVTFSNVTDTTGVGTGSVQLAGGMYVAKKLYAANTTITQAQGAAFMCNYALTDTLATAWEAKHIASFSAAGVRKGTIGVVKTATDADGDFSAIRFAWTPSTVPDDDSLNDYRAYLELGSLSAGSGADYWEIGKDATASAQGTALLWGDMVGNVIIGGGRTKATSAVNVLHVLNGTAPSAALANGITFYSKDWNGAGTAVPHIYDEEGLSGPLVKVTSGGAVNIKYIDIGDWDMLTATGTSTVSVAHGLTLAKIRAIQVFIIRDDGTTKRPLDTATSGSVSTGNFIADATNIILTRFSGSIFDSTNYDSTSFNRGYIRIEYIN